MYQPCHQRIGRQWHGPPMLFHLRVVIALAEDLIQTRQHEEFLELARCDNRRWTKDEHRWLWHVVLAEMLPKLVVGVTGEADPKDVATIKGLAEFASNCCNRDDTLHWLTDGDRDDLRNLSIAMLGVRNKGEEVVDEDVDTERSLEALASLVRAEETSIVSMLVHAKEWPIVRAIVEANTHVPKRQSLRKLVTQLHQNALVLRPVGGSTAWSKSIDN